MNTCLPKFILIRNTKVEVYANEVPEGKSELFRRTLPINLLLYLLLCSSNLIK